MDEDDPTLLNPIILVPEAIWTLVYTDSADHMIALGLVGQGPDKKLIVIGTGEFVMVPSYARVFACYKTGTDVLGRNKYTVLLSVMDETTGNLFSTTCWQGSNVPAVGSYDKANGLVNPDPSWVNTPVSLN